MMAGTVVLLSVRKAGCERRKRKRLHMPVRASSSAAGIFTTTKLTAPSSPPKKAKQLKEARNDQSSGAGHDSRAP